MKYGFTFRGKHSSEFGLIVKTKKRPVIAPIREEGITIPHRDGAIDCAAQGGRVFYDNKTVEVSLTVSTPDLRATQLDVAKIVSWLSGWYDDLIFDDMPSTVWTARPVNLGNISISLCRVGEFTVEFNCMPFNHFIYDMDSYDIVVGSKNIFVGSRLPLSYGIGGSRYDLKSGANSIKFYYYGDAPCKPIFTINQASEGIKLKIGSNAISYSGNFNRCVVDCENWTVSADEMDVTAVSKGDFPELVPGENIIEITQTNDSQSIVISGRTNFLYGEKWGFVNSHDTYI